MPQGTDHVRLGFLTAVAVPDLGYLGGLLVTNRHGRPLEFQCTTPVKPNRVQEVLYGPTLAPFLLGELIGKTLYEKAGVKPHLLLTEQAEILELRNHVPAPIGCVTTDASGDRGEPGRELTVGKHRLRFHDAHPDDCAAVEKQAAQIPRDADLLEPFARVREALMETVRLTPAPAGR